MRSLAATPQPEFTLVLTSGPEKGSIYKLVASQVRIGRGSDNDISIQHDPKLSRHHAVLLITPEGYQISDVSERNKIFVDGREVRSTILKSGSQIQLGETTFQFQVLWPSQPASLVSSPSSSPQELSRKKGDPLSSARSSRRKPKEKKVTFYILIGIVATIFIWLLNSNAPKKESSPLRSEEDIEQNIDANKKIIESAEAEKKRLGLDSRQYLEAQPNFVKGFRDYRKGQYERAAESFQACLALFPKHAQCQRYFQLSKKKLSELIQYHMVLAGKYRSQNQFAACKSSYRNVMVMVKNPNDKIYQEAKAGYEVCETLEGDRF